MSVNLDDRRNLGTLAALVIGTLVVAAAGMTWLRSNGAVLIEELAFLILVLVVAVYLYDRFLIM